MEINRSVVKQQAKALIKNNVFKLFIITVIIGIVTGGGMSFSGVGSGAGGVFDTNPFSQSDSRSDDDSDKESDKGSDYKNINPYDEFDRDYFNDFDGNGRVTLVKAEQEIPSGFKWAFLGLMGLFGVFASLAGLFLSPLQITLKGVFLQLIHGNNLSFGDGLSYVFKKTFDKNYWAKFVLNLIQGILLAILYVLFIIPGVIFTYRWRFTEYILADKPELSFSDAMRISGKMTAGHKWELFVLDLSFIPWYLLMIPTLGLINIYVVPYYNTTMALYYENFKARAFLENAVTQYDFMSDDEKMLAAPQQTYYYAQPQNNYYQPAPTYTMPQQPVYNPAPQETADVSTVDTPYSPPEYPQQPTPETGTPQPEDTPSQDSGTELNF